MVQRACSWHTTPAHDPNAICAALASPYTHHCDHNAALVLFAPDLGSHWHSSALRDVHGTAVRAAGVAGHPHYCCLGGQLPAEHTYGRAAWPACTPLVLHAVCSDSSACVVSLAVWQHSLHRHLVFGTGGAYWKSLIATYVSYSASIVISSGITYGLERIGVGEQASYFISTAATGVVNYFMLASAFEPAKKEVD